MSAYPLMLEGEGLYALVVGAGSVGERRARALLESGATVQVVSPAASDALVALAATEPRLQLARRPWRAGDVGIATLVIAATDDPAVNAEVVTEARTLGRLVNVADVPEAGNCWSPAVHRAGDVVVAVTAGGVPRVAMRIRDAIAARLDVRFAAAAAALGALRRRLLDAGDRAGWQGAQAALVGDDFCAAVERGDFVERVRRWG